MKKYILFDIDGTLIENKKYPENMDEIKEQIKILQSQENVLGICTYRPFDSKVKQIMRDYNIEGPVISEGGACFWKKEESKYVLKKIVPDRIVDLKKNIYDALESQDLHAEKDAFVNVNRIVTSTIRISESKEEKINKFVEALKNIEELSEQEIKQCKDNKFKILIEPKHNNKISAIKNFFKNENVVLISDNEDVVEEHDSNIKVYSVGENETFNAYADAVFGRFGEGVEKILIKIKEEDMGEYEQLSSNCKICWRENFNLTKEKYTQVSGYIFNENNQLLIVRNGDTWTIPGGHPEANETQLDTLNREIMEEACVTIKDANYLGAVEVVEDEQYYQIRYTAKVDEVLDFDDQWETSERKFIDLEDLPNYIKWSKGIMFSRQIESAKKFWNI